MRAYVVVDGGDDDRANHENPVCHWNIDLAMELLAGVDHLDLREVAHVHDLGQQLKRGGNHSLGRDNGGQD